MAFAAPEKKEKEFNSFLYVTDPSKISYLVVFPNEKLTGREMFDRLKKDPSLITSGKVEVYMAAYKGAPLEDYHTGRYSAGGGTDADKYAAFKLRNRIEDVKYVTYNRYPTKMTPSIGVQKDTSPLLSDSAAIALDKLKPVKLERPDVEKLVPYLTRPESLDVAVTTRNDRGKTRSYERETRVPKPQEITAQKRVVDPVDQKIARIVARNKEKAAQAAELERQKEAAKPVLAFKFANSEYRIEGITRDQFIAIARTGEEKIFAQSLSKYVIRDEKGDVLDQVDRYALIYDLYHQKGGAKIVFLKDKKKVNES